MIVYSKTYPGPIVICEECGCLFGYDPHSEIYEEKYVYCPLCKHKTISGIRDASWEYAIKGAQSDDKKDTSTTNDANTASDM